VPWVKLDDKFPDHHKVAVAGPLASWLYVCGLAYCNRMLTDGFIPTGMVRRLADVDGAMRLAARLVAAGMWEPVEGGYLVHDYADYQPTRERVETVSEVRAEAGRRGGKQKSSNLLEVCQDGCLANGLAKSYPVPVPVPVPVNLASRETETLSLSVTDVTETDLVETGLSPPWPDRAWANDAFDQTFWPPYPRKTHKQLARAAYVRKLLAQPTFDDAFALARTIMEAVHEQAQHWTDPTYTPTPDAYLNGERWTDEHIVPTGHRGRRR
jgi:hypothetical protein